MILHFPIESEERKQVQSRCQICFTNKEEIDNPFLRCTNTKSCCNYAHLKCLGLIKIPQDKETWICEFCSSTTTLPPLKCDSCLIPWGPLLVFPQENIFRHIACSKWLDHYNSNKEKEKEREEGEIEEGGGQELIPCSICKQATHGKKQMLSCMSCSSYFHVMCGGFHDQAFLKIQECQIGSVKESIYYTLCPSHSWKEENIAEKMKLLKKEWKRTKLLSLQEEQQKSLNRKRKRKESKDSKTKKTKTQEDNKIKELLFKLENKELENQKLKDETKHSLQNFNKILLELKQVKDLKEEKEKELTTYKELIEKSQIYLKLMEKLVKDRNEENTSLLNENKSLKTILEQERQSKQTLLTNMTNLHGINEQLKKDLILLQNKQQQYNINNIITRQTQFPPTPSFFPPLLPNPNPNNNNYSYFISPPPY